MNNFNYQCEIFRKTLYKIVQDSGLPIAVVYYIVDGLKKELENTYYATLNAESSIDEVEEK